MIKDSKFLAIAFVMIFSFAGISFFAHAAETLLNPLKENTVGGLACLIVNFLVQKLMPPIAVFMVLYASFLLLIAGGNPGKVQSARQILVYTIVGAGILLLAPAIIALVAGLFGDQTVNQLTMPGGNSCSAATAGATVVQTLVNIINWFSWLLAVLSVAVGLYAGFLYMTASGDARKVSVANHTLVYAIIGIAVAVLAFSIISIVEGFIR